MPQIDVLRRRLLFRAWRRGSLESDLSLGRFADRRLGDFDLEELTLFEHILEADDPEIEDWINNRVAVPRQYDNRVMAGLLQFCRAGEPS